MESYTCKVFVYTRSYVIKKSSKCFVQNCHNSALPALRIKVLLKIMS